jgi:hypothetical protein
MKNIFLEEAIKYADLGFYVFPCREKPASKSYIDEKGKIRLPREKSPYISGGFHQATIDKNQIADWWHQYPRACIGISCGVSNLFLIDVDVKKGRKGIDNYMMLGISDSGALHSRTPSKGIHILFSGNGKSSTDTEKGIDTRGEGGYFIAPPSVIFDGDYSGKYVALDEWNRVPELISDEDLTKLNIGKNKEHKSRIDYYTPDKINNPETIRRVKESLEELPMSKVNNYYDWISVGLALKTMGEAGYILWRDWSKKSVKFDESVCEEKWESFDPEQISISSIFFWAKNEK